MTEEFKQLQAENATLKAHNRQMVAALDHIVKTLNHDVHLIYGKGQKVGNSVWLHNPSNMRRDAEFYSKILQTPPAKLALAEAEVLRAAEGLMRKVEAYYVDDDTICEITSDLDYAVEAMQEAKRGGY